MFREERLNFYGIQSSKSYAMDTDWVGTGLEDPWRIFEDSVLKLEDIIKPMVVIFSRAGDTRKLFYNDGLLTWEQAALWKLRAARDCTPAASYCPDVASTPRLAVDGSCPGPPLIHQHRWYCARAKQSVDRDRHGLPPQIGLRRGEEAVGPARPYHRGGPEEEGDEAMHGH